MTALPDVTKAVFHCLACTWQVQAGPKARSELGGATETYKALCWAIEVHRREEHPAEEYLALMSSMGVPMTSPDGTPLNGACLGIPLPRWWVEKW